MKPILLLLISLLILNKVVAQWQNEQLYGGSIVSLTANDSAVFALAEGEGIYASYDEGNIWTPFLLSTAVTQIAAKDSCIYAVINGKLSFSNSYGRDWLYSSFVDTSDVNSLFATDSGVYVKYTSNNVFYTQSNDLGWEKIDELPSLNVVEINDTLVKITGQKGVYISYNKGEIWNLIQDTEWTLSVRNIVKCNNSAFIGSDKGVFRVNLKDTLLELKSSRASRKLFAHNSKLYSCPWYDGILISTDDGKSWTSSNQGLSNIHATSIAFNDKLFVTAKEGVYYYDTYNAEWRNFSTGIAVSYYADFVNNISFSKSNIFIGSENGFFMLSKDESLWVQPSGGSINKVFYIEDSLYGLTENQGIFRSSDNGLNWTEINSGLPEFYFEDSYYPFTTTIFSFKSNLFLGTDYGLYKSEINNINWEETDLGNNRRIVSCVISDDIIYIGTRDDGIFASSDLGDTWEQLNNGLSGLYIASLAAKGKYLFAGTDQNIFYSENQGENWRVLGEGLTDKKLITSICILDSVIYAGTRSNGVWKLSSPFNFNSIFSEKKIKVLIYPNPVHETMNIQLKDNYKATKSVSLINTFGQTLKFQITFKHNQIIQFDMSGYSPGLYFVKIEYSDETEIAKIIKQ